MQNIAYPRFFAFIINTQYFSNRLYTRHLTQMGYPLQIPSQLCAQLKSQRKSRGLTQTQLGALIGVGQARIAAIEKNPASVNFDQLFKLLTALNMQLVLRERPSRSADSLQDERWPRGEW